MPKESRSSVCNNSAPDPVVGLISILLPPNGRLVLPSASLFRSAVLATGFRPPLLLKANNFACLLVGLRNR
ncbi:CTP synthase [Trichinella pseudospiralis]